MLDALREGRASGSPLNIKRHLARDILRVIKAGWQKALACPDVDRDTGEVELNGRLYEGMCAAVDEKVVQSHKGISVLPGTESWSYDAGAAADGLTDISIHLSDIRERLQLHGPHAVIECKRVAGNSGNLCRLYVTEGVDRFASGKYAGKHALAFMAGYVVAGSVSEAVARVNARLKRYNRGSEILGPSTLLGEEWTRTSAHVRATSEQFLELHHALLEFGAT